MVVVPVVLYLLSVKWKSFSEGRSLQWDQLQLPSALIVAERILWSCSSGWVRAKVSEELWI